MKSYRGSLALKLTNLLALVVISFGLLAQTPDFQINNNSQCFEGNRFVFTNHSSMGASAFLWNFGDGTTSTDSCPVKVFTYSGNYSVQLMVTYNNINYFINKTVEVNPEPICGFTYYAATNTGNSYTFQSTSYINSGNAIYSWNFGDSSYATGSNPSHIYTNNGLYKVTISGLSNKGCTCSSSKNVMVTVSAGGIVDTMNFNVNNNTQCLTGNNFTFNNTSGYINGASFSWNFGDGTTSASSNPTHNYTTSGSFIVSLIANIGGTDYVKTQIITVHPKTQITIGSSESVICRGTPVTFTAYPYYISGTASYTWLLNNKIVGNNSTTYTNPSVNGSDIVTNYFIIK